jgi:ribosomal protein S12 methylthiotransferase
VSDLCARIRAQLPDITLRTTCLVGYPGETAVHFRHLRDYLAVADFDHLGVFTFFREEGTPAARTTRPGVSTRQAADRRRALLRAQQNRVMNHARAQIGQMTTLMLEKPTDRPGCWLARGPNQAPEVDGQTIVDRVPRSAHPGDFCDARWTGFDGYDRMAQVFLDKRLKRP